MQNAQLKKQWWTTEFRSKLGALTQTKPLCKSSLGSSSTSERNYKADRFAEVWPRPLFFYFPSALWILSLTSKWVFIQVRCTHNYKSWKEEGSKSKNAGTTLSQVHVLMSFLCSSCSSNTISTTTSSPASNTAGHGSQRCWNRMSSICNDKSKTSHFPHVFVSFCPSEEKT